MNGNQSMRGPMRHTPQDTSETSIVPSRIASSAPLGSSCPAMSDNLLPACGSGIIRTMTSPYPHPRNSPILSTSTAAIKKDVQWVHNPGDGSVLLDHRNEPVSVDRLLATKPLRHELSTRPGPGGKKLTYISGEGVSRTLNDIFGFDGWNLDITAVNQAECSQDDKARYTVVYTAQVRLTHKTSGTYKEDVGAGDATDRSKGTAISNAMKASITDAMKRAARHFGDKLGNSLYQGNFSVSKAPISLQDALDKHAIERANTKFGFTKDVRNSHDGGEATACIDGKNNPVKDGSGPATKAPSPPPPPSRRSSPLPKVGAPVPVVRPASSRYHRGQTQALEANHPVSSSSSSTHHIVQAHPATAPPAAAPAPPALPPRPTSSYGRPHQPPFATTSASMSGGGDGGAGGQKMSLGSLHSLGMNTATAPTTSSAITTSGGPPPGSGKRPPLRIIPPNLVAATAAISGVVSGDNKRVKTNDQYEQRHHSSMGGNPYNSAGMSSSSSYPKTGRSSI